MTIAVEIKSLRKSRGMTQADLKRALESAHQRSEGRPPDTLSTCPLQQIENWETGMTLPSFRSLRALAYVLDPNPQALIERWGAMWQRENDDRRGMSPREKGELMERNRNAQIPEALPSVPAPAMDKAIPAPTMADPSASGNVDLFLSDGNETLRFDGVGVEEAVRRFRDFLTWQILPDGGHAVFVSCVEYPRKGSK